MTQVSTAAGFPIYRDRDGLFWAFTGTKRTRFNTLREAQDALSGF